MTKEQRDELRRLSGVVMRGPCEVKKGAAVGCDDYYVAIHCIALWDDNGRSTEVEANYIAAACNSIIPLLDEIDRLERAKDFPDKFAMQNTLHQQAIEIARLKADKAAMILVAPLAAANLGITNDT